MAGTNRIVIVGRLVENPDLRVTPGGTSVANFTLAVERRPNRDGSKEVDYVDCVAFSQTAEASTKYLAKGKYAAVDGRLQSRSFETKAGDKRKVWEVICDNVQFLSPRDKGERQDGDYE